MTRGSATRRTLVAALDRLGIGTGQEFMVCHPRALLRELDDVEPPEHKAKRGGPDTSREAAKLAFPRGANQRRRILDALHHVHPAGMTCEAVAQATVMPYESCSARAAELKQGGWVVPRGTRPTSKGADADVLYLTDAALVELAAANGVLF